MSKTCQSCGYNVALEDEAEPQDAPEDCPKCGGLLSLADEVADLKESGKDQLDEE